MAATTMKPGTPKKSNLPATRAGAATAAKGTEKPEITVFVSYSHLDESYREKLEKHLAPLKREGVKTWFDGRVQAGGELDPEIKLVMRMADLFIALISSNYLSSDYCWNREYLPAMRRRQRGTLHVVGIVLKPCDWKGSTAANFKQLPKDGRAVTDWRSADHALLDATESIRSLVRVIRKEMEAAKPARARKTAGVPKPPSSATAKPAPPPTSPSKPASLTRALKRPRVGKPRISGEKVPAKARKPSVTKVPTRGRKQDGPA